MSKRLALLHLAAGAVVLGLAGPSYAQTGKSAAAAKELVTAMEAAKLDSVAAKLPAGEDQFAAALYIPGSQLLVVSARYSAPQLLEPRLAAKEFRDIYIELNGAGTPDSKVFISDLGANGLADRKQNNLSDSWEQGAKRVTFDGEWGDQKMQEADYRKAYTAADEQYAALLAALAAAAKK
jgi:hypothetical protein